MKKILCFLLFINNCGHAQGTFNHQINIPEFPFHVLTSVLPTDSCYYATGIITDTSNQSYTVGNIFMKFDLLGNVEFYKKLSDPYKYYETWRGDLIVGANGNLLDIGYHTDTIRSAFVVNYSTSGEVISLHPFSNPLYPGEDFIVTASLKKDSAGVLSILCGIDNSLGGNDADIYFLKMDSGGEVLDSFVYGDPSVVEIPYSMLLDDDGGAIIGANKTNWGYVSNNFYSQAYLFKIDSLGEVEWEYTTAASQLFDIARDMVRTPDGGIVVATGKGKEYPINSSSSQLRWSPYVLKLDASHDFEWGTEINGLRQSPESYFLKIVPAQDGSGFVCTGRIDEDVSIGEQAIGSWVVKISSEGDSLWARYYSFFDSIPSEPQPKDLKATPDGGYLIVGETYPRFPDGQVQRAWIMKLDEHGCLIPGCEANDTVSTGISLPQANPVRLAIYPNPTSDYLNFQLRSQPLIKAAHFRIMDATGRVVRDIESNMPTETHIVPVHGWAVGVYFLQYVENGLIRSSEKFVVLKE